MKAYAIAAVLSMLLVVSGILLTTCWSPGRQAESYEAVRQAWLDGLKAGAGLGERYILRPVPLLSAGSPYEVGSAFVADTFPLRHTTACIPARVPILSDRNVATLSSTDAGQFDLSFGIPTIIQKYVSTVTDFRVAVENADKVNLQYDLAERNQLSELAGYEDELAENVECLTDIANRDVYLIAQVFSVKETFRSDDTLGGSTAIQVFEDDSFKISYNREGTFTLEDREPKPKIWALLKYRAEIPNFDPSWRKERRLAAVEEALALESGRGVRLAAVQPSRSQAEGIIVEDFR